MVPVRPGEWRSTGDSHPLTRTCVTSTDHKVSGRDSDGLPGVDDPLHDFRGGRANGRQGLVWGGQPRVGRHFRRPGLPVSVPHPPGGVVDAPRRLGSSPTVRVPHVGGYRPGILREGGSPGVPVPRVALRQRTPLSGVGVLHVCTWGRGMEEVRSFKVRGSLGKVDEPTTRRGSHTPARSRWRVVVRVTPDLLPGSSRGNKGGAGVPDLGTNRTPRPVARPERFGFVQSPVGVGGFESGGRDLVRWPPTDPGGEGRGRVGGSGPPRPDIGGRQTRDPPLRRGAGVKAGPWDGRRKRGWVDRCGVGSPWSGSESCPDPDWDPHRPSCRDTTESVRSTPS